jgi:two-component system NarL family response regulator
MTKESSHRIKLMIVDDHPTFRMGLVSLINAQPDMKVVAEVATGEEALAGYSNEISVVLMDLRLPGMGGVEAIISILVKHPDAKVIVLTTYDADEDVFRAMRSGAKSYLLKDMSTEEITGTIRHVFQGSTEIPPKIAERLAERAQRQALTAREQEVLQLLVRGRSNKEIGTQLFISDETVKSHLKTLFAKLKVRDRTEAAICAIRHGIVRL